MIDPAFYAGVQFLNGNVAIGISNQQAAQFSAEVNNLSALTNGQISFNVTLHEGESGILESVLLNDTCYLWSDGNQEDPNILKGETKHWSARCTFTTFHVSNV